MTKPEVRRFAGVEELSRAAGAEFVRAARDAIAARGRFVVALAGGSTPRRLYQLLAEEPWRGQVDWPRVEFFWGDERTVPPDHPDSNYRMAREALLQKLTLGPAQVHRLEAERTDLEAAARDYQEAIALVCKVPPTGSPPAFDLILLGLGPDGHTASLFPYTEALQEDVRWVVPNEVPQLKTQRMTLTKIILNQAAEIHFQVAGANKAQALAEVLEGPADPERLPAQLIQPTSGRLLWFVDQAAAAGLRS